MSDLIYQCPSCDSDLTVDASCEALDCPECKKRIVISFDSDFENGRWVDCTKLSVDENVGNIDDGADYLEPMGTEMRTED